jgi:hypothetical protein
MKLVIELDDDLVNGIKEIDMEHARLAVRSFQATIADAIKNGKPLPTDAVDRVTIKEYLDSFGKDTNVTATDAVDRQEAINAAIEGADKWDGGYNNEREKCIREEIAKLPSVTPQPCEDCVSRRAVYEILNDAYFLKIDDGAALQESVRQLPPVTPQQKMGKWKAFTHSAYRGNDEDGEPIWREVTVYHCDLCNRRTVIKEKYCPNCGCKMQEVNG